tara:strand:- start:3834 stop:4193 length:360 start_codon:yes stop_codon:yes gene_type:complete
MNKNLKSSSYKPFTLDTKEKKDTSLVDKMNFLGLKLPESSLDFGNFKVDTSAFDLIGKSIVRDYSNPARLNKSISRDIKEAYYSLSYDNPLDSYSLKLEKNTSMGDLPMDYKFSLLLDF